MANRSWTCGVLVVQNSQYACGNRNAISESPPCITFTSLLLRATLKDNQREEPYVIVLTLYVAVIRQHKAWTPPQNDRASAGTSQPDASRQEEMIGVILVIKIARMLITPCDRASSVSASGTVALHVFSDDACHNKPEHHETRQEIHGVGCIGCLGSPPERSATWHRWQKLPRKSERGCLAFVARTSKRTGRRPARPSRRRLRGRRRGVSSPLLPNQTIQQDQRCHQADRHPED